MKLIKLDKNNGLEDMLSLAYGVLVKVKKEREIYFIGNAKIHLDVIEGLGSFIEIEVIDDKGVLPLPDLESKCRMLMDDFKVSKENLIDVSYSDMLLK